MQVFFIFRSVGTLLLYPGLFGVVTDNMSVSVMEGDSVTLNTGIEKNPQDRITWYYNDIRIAQLNGDPNKTCTDVQCTDGPERFRDRLKLDHQTGSLTIMNIRNTDAGDYKLLITRVNIDSETIFSVSVQGVSADEQEKMKKKSVKEGERNVKLDPVVTKNPNNVIMWYFNDIIIAEITGSLTITHIRTEDSGEYKLQIKNSRFSITKSFSVSVTGSGLSSGAVAGIVVGVVVQLVCVASAVGVMYLRHRSSRKGMEENKQRASVESPSKEMENFLPTKIEVT